MLSVILPTFNEAENIPTIVKDIEKALSTWEYEIIVVDDNSPDGTWHIARELGKNHPAVRVIRRVGRRGLSSAVIEGFLAARGDIFIVADADGQHDLRLIPAIAEAVKSGAGIALGSRYVEGGSVGQWDERRHLLSKIATSMAIRLCKVRVSDPMSGFFGISRDAFEEILPRLNPKGFKILLDLLVHAPRSLVAREIPFTFGARTHGESKLSRRVQIEFLEYLYEAAFGRFIPLTLVQYCVVGTIGVAINLLTFWLISSLFPWFMTESLSVSPPVLLGIEAAIIASFYLNNAWTFSHVKLQGMRAVFGFLRYNIICAFGALTNIAVIFLLYRGGASEITSLTVGAFVGMVWNYTISLLFTWKAA
jgi:dolichol-phosphate mannosyltransferase